MGIRGGGVSNSRSLLTSFVYYSKYILNVYYGNYERNSDINWYKIEFEFDFPFPKCSFASQDTLFSVYGL